MKTPRTHAPTPTRTHRIAAPSEPTDFAAVYDLYRDSIFRYCVSRSRNREIAEDLMQETFLRFWMYVQRHREILMTRALLYRIAHNLFIDSVRRKKEVSLDQCLEKGFEPTVDPWHMTYSRLDAEKPLRALHRMPRQYKEVLQRRFIRGMNPADIAAETGETSNVISVRIFRGIKHLRLLLA